MNSDIIEDLEWPPAAENSSSLLSPKLSGKLVSYSLPAPGLSLESFLRQAEGHSRFFWQRGNGEAAYAGFGTAVQLMAWGENRFKEIQSKARALFDRSEILGSYTAPVLPRLFGGFSFRDDFTPDNTWAVFHPAHFVLPHYQLVQTQQDTWLTINALAVEGEDLLSLRDQLHQALEARYQLLLHKQSNQLLRDSNRIVQTRYPMNFDTWNRLLTLAVQTMNDSSLNKVVLARVCELRAHSRINVYEALSYLNENYQECARFLFEPRPYHAFYGATPELLVKVAGKQVTTMALASSRPRGDSDESDKVLAQDLMQNAKERLEHKLVVDAVRKRLEPLASHLSIPDQPQILRLSYIQHLLTSFSGELRQQEGVLPLVELLHPTPALGGSPRKLALDFISANEPVPRGWYAGPVGWFDKNMDGEFVVAIRSAVAQERRVWCYAGAGIVPDSRPDIEWDETGLKFRPMLRALGILPDVNDEQAERSVNLAL